MEAKKETPPNIIDQLKEYLETRIKLARYNAIERGTTVAGSLIAEAVAIISMVLAFMFASLALGFYLGDVLGANWKGFGCVAILYLIIALVLKVNKQKIETNITDEFVKKIFKNEE